MDPTLELAAVVALVGLAAWGWGRPLRYLGDRRPFRYHALTALLGLALLQAIGGVLQLCHLATRPALLGLLGIGWILAALELRRCRLRRPSRGAGLSSAVPPVLALALTLATCHWLAPAGVFNIHDDFHTYATRAVRLAQTGFMGGNPFDQLGLDSLGSQSFFHAFLLQPFSPDGYDIRLLNGFDAVLCFGLCLVLLAELTLRWRLPWWLGAMAVLGAWWINPQYVNISPLYSGVAAILGLGVVGAFWARSLSSRAPDNDAARSAQRLRTGTEPVQPVAPDATTARPRTRVGARRTWATAIFVGLFAGWLVTLKLTLVPFVAFYLAGLAGLTFWHAPNRRAAVRACARAGAVIVAVVLPWAVAPLPALLEARSVGAALQPEAVLTANESIASQSVGSMLQANRLWHGNTPIAFLSLACFGAAIAGMGLASFLAPRRRRRPQVGQASSPLALGSIIAAGLALLPTYLLNGHLFTQSNAIRYACPVLIGGVLIAALGFLRFSSRPGTARRRRLCGALAACFLGLAFAFAPSVSFRINAASRFHTLLSYPINHTFASYSRAMAAGNEFNYARRLQYDFLPEGDTALVWVVAPFHFNFDRNRLFVASEPGLVNPALQFPAGVPLERFAAYLRAQGIRHVLLETNGYGIRELDELAGLTRSKHALDRRLGHYGAYFRRSLLALAACYPVRYADDRMVLFDLTARPRHDADAANAHRPATNSLARAPGSEP